MLESPPKYDILVIEMKAPHFEVSRIFEIAVIIDHNMGTISRKLERGSSETIR
jgi:hypothetical protein